MKKRTARLLALLLAAVMVLSACGGDNSSTSGDDANNSNSTATTPANNDGESAVTPIKDWRAYALQSSELDTFLILNTESSGTVSLLMACSTPLLERGAAGPLVPAAAKEWGSEDNGLTWTFKIRDDIVWVDVNGNEKAKTVAHDWVTALEWILNFHKNGGYNTSMPNQLIAGAEDYYNYTKELDEAAALALSADDGPFLEMVGIEAPDDYTLIYHCCKNAPYFETLCPNAPLFPLSQAQVDEMGVDGVKSQDNTTMWYNGTYTITEFIMNNSKTLTKNPTYWDKDAGLFDTVTYTMVDSALTAQTMFMNGDIDSCSLGESNLRTIYENPDNEWYPYLCEARPTIMSYQFHFNYAKNKEDGTPDDNWNNAIANESFRKSLYYGMDLTNYWARYNFIHPESCENLAFTMIDQIYYPDGRDYVQAVWDRLGFSSGRYDAEKGQQYKEQAMQELAGKVTFPVEVDYYILGGDQNALDSATVLKEIVEALGTDYITLNIKTGVSNLRQEIYASRYQSWVITGWGADYRDPENFICQEFYGDDSAFYTKNYSNINLATDPDLISAYQEFTELGRKASSICDDMTKRYDAYADAEFCLLDHALVVPCYYNITWELTKRNGYKSMAGFKNWETSTEPYTTEQYEQFKADFYAAKAAKATAK